MILETPPNGNVQNAFKVENSIVCDIIITMMVIIITDFRLRAYMRYTVVFGGCYA
jgi:hypothetical protein